MVFSLIWQLFCSITLVNDMIFVENLSVCSKTFILTSFKIIQRFPPSVWNCLKYSQSLNAWVAHLNTQKDDYPPGFRERVLSVIALCQSSTVVGQPEHFLIRLRTGMRGRDVKYFPKLGSKTWTHCCINDWIDNATSRKRECNVKIYVFDSTCSNYLEKV